MNRLHRASKLVVATLILTFGVLIVAGNVVVGNRSTSQSFESEPVKVLNLEITDVPEEDKPKKIIIPKLSIDLSVKESEIKQGYWEVFDDVAGWGVGSSPPGYQGNQVIFAHARNGLFGELEEIENGDSIYVFNRNERFIYKVTEIKEVYPGQVEVIEQTGDERLTLYTCSGFQDEKRLVVIARRETV